MASTQVSSVSYKARRVREYMADLWTRRDFAWFLAIGNFKAKNATTALGLFWWVLNPLLLSLVYFVIFGVIFPNNRDLIYLMSGMFVFHFSAQSLNRGPNAILQNAKLLVNVRFPRLILPIANLLESMIGFAVSLVVLLILQVFLRGYVPGPQVALLLVALPLSFIFNLGLSALSGRLSVPFRDINNFLPYVTRMWLYLSPVIWPLTLLERDGAEFMARLVHANPMFYMIAVYRSALIGDPLNPSDLIAFAAFALTIGLVGVAAYIKYEGQIVRYL